MNKTRIDEQYFLNQLKWLYEKETPAYNNFTGNEGKQEALRVLYQNLMYDFAEAAPDYWEPIPDNKTLPINKPIIIQILNEYREAELTYPAIKKDGQLYYYGIGGEAIDPITEYKEEDFDVYLEIPQYLISK